MINSHGPVRTLFLSERPTNVVCTAVTQKPKSDFTVKNDKAVLFKPHSLVSSPALGVTMAEVLDPTVGKRSCRGGGSLFSS